MLKSKILTKYSTEIATAPLFEILSGWCFLRYIEHGRIAYYPTYYRRTGGYIILCEGRERCVAIRLAVEGTTRSVPGEVGDWRIEPLQHASYPFVRHRTVSNVSALAHVGANPISARTHCAATATGTLNVSAFQVV